MNFKDCGIFSPKLDSARNLVFTIKVKKEDYTEQMADFIFDCYEQGKSLDFEIVWLDEKPDEDIMIKLRGKLGAMMNEYAQVNKIKIEDEKNRIYNKYQVKSRTELTRSQLEELCDSYYAGLYL